MPSIEGRCADEVAMEKPDFASVERAFQAARAAREAGGPVDVTAVCGGDAALAAEVRSLLRHGDAAGADDVTDDPHRTRNLFLDPGELHGLRPHGPQAGGPDLLGEWGASAAGQRVGEFTLIEPLGTGGMGVVFVARQERPQRTIALKLIRTGAATPALLRRFEREAQLLGRLNHPGIAQIYAAGVADIRTELGATVRTPYIAMELVQGGTILEYVRHRGGRPALALELIAQVCEAIQHAHQRGVIHRDLKPANVLVAVGPEDQPQVKVLDFGVARQADDAAGDAAETQLTFHGHLIGTLAYMSPEQMRSGAEVDTRCDVYALGVILYQLLTGRLPIDLAASPLADAARRVAEERPPTLGSLDRSLRGDVETIVEKALEKEPARRYESPAALARDIRLHLAGETIEARRASLIYVLRKRAARYQMITLAACMLLGMAVAFALYARHEQRLQARAENAADSARADAEAARARAVRTSAHLAEELSAVHIEQGRLLGQTDLAAAERLLWDERLDHPDSRPARWALRELYWRSGCVATFRAHAGACRTLAVAPDQTRFATGGDDGFVRVWSMDDRTKLVEISPGFPTIQAVRFSPDSKTLAVAGSGGARLYDLATGAARELGGAGGASYCVKFHPGGAAIVVGTEDGVTRVFDVASGAELASIKPDEAGATRVGGAATADLPRGVDFDAAGQNLAVIYLGGAVRLWHFTLDGDRATVSPGPAVAGHPGSSGAALAFSPDGASLATGGTDRSVKLWRVADGSLANRFITNNGTARSVHFSPDGARLVVPGYWRTQIFEVRTGAMSTLGDAGGFAARFAAGGRRLIVADTDGVCRVWDFAATPATVLSSTKWLVRDLAAARADGQCLLASIQADGELRLRARPMAGDGGWTERISMNVGGRARSLAMTADGRRIVVGRDDGRLVTIRTRDAAVIQNAPAHAGTINAVRLSDDGRTLVTAGADKIARLWRWRDDDGDGVWQEQMTMPCAGEIVGAAISPDGARVATTCRPASFRIWSAADGHILHESAPAKAPWKPVFSPDGAWLAIGAWDLSIQFWNVENASAGGARHELSLLGHTQLISAQAFDDSGNFLASVSNDGALRLWDVSRLPNGASNAPLLDRRRCLATFDAGAGDAYAVTFLPGAGDGGEPRSVAAGYIDGTVRVWDLGRLEEYLRGHADYQRSLRPH